MRAASIVELNSVTLVLGNKVILDNVTFSLPVGQISLIMGSSGAGKTSVLRLITGQIRPISGQVIVDGEVLEYKNIQHLYSVRKNIGMVFQSGALFADLTVAANIALPLQEHLGLSFSASIDRVDSALQAVGLDSAGELYPWELSGGMLKRAAIARASILEPGLMLYDEPLAGQDPITCNKLLDLIQARKLTSGCASIIVSHNIRAMVSLVDYVVMLHQGKILFADKVNQLAHSHDSIVQGFIAGCDFG